MEGGGRNLMKHLLGFVGYGEAAYHISMGLASEGLTGMIAWDAAQDDPERGKIVQARAKETGVMLVGSLEEVCSQSDFILSLTSPSVCVEVAKRVLPLLRSGQVFCDLNSADPADMALVDRLPKAAGVKFVDVALLGAVPKGKHRTKMYLSGDGAKDFYEAVRPWNTILKLLEAPAGGASAVKMFKSVFSKGLPQLFLETYVSAAAYGVLDQILDLTRDTFQERNIEQYCDENLYRTLIHAERRAQEAGACAKTVERLGYDASMSRATEAKLKQLSKRRYKERIGDSAPGMRTVIQMVMQDQNEKEGD